MASKRGAMERGVSAAPTRVRRRFPQPRAQATFRALLAAARELFAARGFDATQTPDIAAAAGVATGTFYRYFDDKRQCFVEMISEHLAEVHAHVMGQLDLERLRGGEGQAVIATAIDILFAQVRRTPALYELFLEMSLRDPEVAKLRRDFDALSQGALASLIALVVPASVVADPHAAAMVIERAATEVAMTYGGGGVRSPSEAAVKRALREMIERYLFPEKPAPERPVPERPARPQRRR